MGSVCWMLVVGVVGMLFLLFGGMFVCCWSLGLV